MEGRKHSIQIIANDFNGFNNLCSQIVYFFEFFCFCSPFLCLTLTNDMSYWFDNECLVNLFTLISLKAYDFQDYRNYLVQKKLIDFSISPHYFLLNLLPSLIAICCIVWTKKFVQLRLYTIAFWRCY